MTNLGILFLILLVIGFWFDTQRTHIIARAFCKRVCQELRLQLLDDTVALIHIRLKRNARGNLTFQRTYTFEVTEQGGNSRHTGTILMRGKVLEMVDLPGYMKRTISPV